MATFNRELLVYQRVKMGSSLDFTMKPRGCSMENEGWRCFTEMEMVPGDTPRKTRTSPRHIRIFGRFKAAQMGDVPRRIRKDFQQH